MISVPERARICGYLSDNVEVHMKDRSIAGAIILLAISVFFVGGAHMSPAATSDQYLVNDGKVFRFPGAVQGSIEVLEKDAQGKYEWVVQ